MIAAHENFAQFAGMLGHFVRAGAVAHDVAQVHYHVECWSAGQGCFEGFEISVNVAEQQYAHESPDKQAIID